MIDRLFRLIVSLLVCFVAIGLGLRLLLDGLAQRHGISAQAPAGPGVDAVAGATIALAFVLFAIGLGVRAARRLTGRGGRGAREHDARERQVRLAVRKPATDVPAIPLGSSSPPDSDPALDLEDGE